MHSRPSSSRMFPISFLNTHPTVAEPSSQTAASKLALIISAGGGIQHIQFLPEEIASPIDSSTAFLSITYSRTCLRNTNVEHLSPLNTYAFLYVHNSHVVYKMNNNLLHCSTFINLPDFSLIRKFLKITPCIGLKRTITCPCSERISHTSLDQGQLKTRCCMSSTSMLHLGHLNSLISPMHTEMLCRNTRLD